MKEGEVLRYLKKQIVDTVNSNIEDEELINFLRSSIKKLHGYVGYNIKKKLIDKYGDKSWVIQMEVLSKPTLQKGREPLTPENKNEIMYIIKNVSWIAGPAPQEVHRSIINLGYERNLPSTTYSPHLYTRRLPFLVNRYTETYNPYPIAGRKLKPIQIYLTKNLYKSNSGDNKQLTTTNKQQQQYYYSLEVKDRHLGSWKGDTKTSVPILINTYKKEDALFRLQEKLEEIYFIKNNPTREEKERHSYLLKYIMEEIGGVNKTVVGQSSVTLTNKPRGVLELSKAERDAVKAEKDAQEEIEKAEMEKEEIEQEGGGGEQPLFGTDGPNVFDDNSIPGEEPMVGEGDGGVPPSPESLDRNYHDDERPDLEEAAERESGEIPSETETREEVPEDAQTEAGIADWLQEVNSIKEYSISDLMNMDKHIIQTMYANNLLVGMEGDLGYILDPSALGGPDISPSTIR